MLDPMENSADRIDRVNRKFLEMQPPPILPKIGGGAAGGSTGGSSGGSTGGAGGGGRDTPLISRLKKPTLMRDNCQPPPGL